MKLYPLQFFPIIKDRIWGGTKLKTVLNKTITSEISGESWEISTVPNDISIVKNGVLKDKSLNELIDSYPSEILGNQVYQRFGKQFPLLFKFIDAKSDLSIQVHPNDELAQKRHNSFGKTEMWYVMQADDEARLIVGFKHKSSPEEYLKNLQNKTLETILDSKKVAQGDVFFLATGTVHAIGAGTVIAEIQQTSDITYRIYDFDRVDANGNKRELQLDNAMDAINFNVVKSKIEYPKQINQSNEVVHCPYFKTNFIALNEQLSIQNDKDSFLVYMCVEGNFEIDLENQKYAYKKGDTVLIPAEIKDFKLLGNASLLEIYI